MVTKSAKGGVASGGHRPAGVGGSWPAAGGPARLAHGARLLRLSRKTDGRTDGSGGGGQYKVSRWPPGGGSVPPDPPEDTLYQDSLMEIFKNFLH